MSGFTEIYGEKIFRSNPDFISLDTRVTAELAKQLVKDRLLVGNGSDKFNHLGGPKWESEAKAATQTLTMTIKKQITAERLVIAFYIIAQLGLFGMTFYDRFKPTLPPNLIPTQIARMADMATKPVPFNQHPDLIPNKYYPSK